MTDRVDRRTELAAGLAEVEARIDAACASAGRARQDVALVVVTKTFPASDVILLRDLGVTDVGENKVQEAAAKSGAEAFAGLRLHLIGRLQSNKALAAGALADVVHSLDRERLIGPLARGRAGRAVQLGATEAGTLPVLLQISLDGDPSRGGVAAENLERLAEAVLASPLRLAGVMAVPPPGAQAGAAFATLAELAGRVRRLAPEATWISAGMSGDLEAAVANGATHLRVGSAILGSRSPFR